MYVNAKPITDYGCEITSRTILPADLQISTEWIPHAFGPIYSKQSYGFKKIDVGLEMKATNAIELEKAKSNLANELKRAVIRFKDIDYLYDGYLSSFGSAPVTTEWEDITISFTALCTKEEKTIQLNKVLLQTFTIEGNLEVPCIYEIKPLTSIIDFQINEIKVHSLPINSTLIINGEDGTILLDGVNKFMDTELDEFPSLTPGVNTVTINNVNCEIKIKYKPRFV